MLKSFPLAFPEPSRAPQYRLRLHSPRVTPIQGEFSYDTTSAGTTNGATSVYPQSLTGGFTAEFGSLAVSASSYEVTVSHDFPESHNSFADIFSVSFASNSTPAPSAPLMVGGTAESVGEFTISFVGPPTIFSSTALPSSLSESSFSSEFDLFSQTPTGLLDLVFSVTSLQAVPEPDSSLLLLVGAIFFLGVFFLKARRKRQDTPLLWYLIARICDLVTPIGFTSNSSREGRVQ